MAQPFEVTVSAPFMCSCGRLGDFSATMGILPGTRAATVGAELEPILGLQGLDMIVGHYRLQPD